MNQIVIIIVLISALMHAFWNLFAKKSRNKLVFIWLVILSSVIMFFPLFFYLLFNAEFFLIFLLYAFTSGIFLSLHFYFLAKTYTLGDLSLGYPIIRSSSLFIFLLAIIFLKESVAMIGVMGIFIIIFGIYIIHLESFKINSFFGSLKNIYKKATFFAILTALFYSISIIVDKIGGNYSHPFLYIYFLWISQIIFIFPFLFFKENKKYIKSELNTNFKSILISGFFITFSYLLILFAFRIDTASQIVSLRQLSIVFGVIFGNLILKEKYGLIRIVGATIIFIGTFLVALS